MKEDPVSNNSFQRLTIGFLIDSLDGRYQSLIWPGVLAAVQEHDANLVIFSGGSLDIPYEYLAQTNVIYDLVAKENVDGIVMLSGGLSEFINKESFEKFYQRFAPLPIVSIAIELDGIPSVLVDNQKGMEELINHLIEVHGYRRIAFICGPEEHEEAGQRFNAYLQVLKKFNIPVDPDLIAPGAFSPGAGKQAIKILLDQRKVRFDAIVAIDDEMALEVMSELQQRGYRIPEDIAVGGFDNVEDAHYSFPSLTTVSQPIYYQAKLATEILIANLRGAEMPGSIHLPTELVVRESCGCVSQLVQSAGKRETEIDILHASTKTKEEYLLSEVSVVIQQAFIENFDSETAIIWGKSLLDSFLRDVEHSTQNFLYTLKGYLKETILLNGRIMIWQDVISSMRRCIYACFPETAIQGEDLFSQARVMIGESMERALGRQMSEARERASLELDTRSSFLATSEMEELLPIIAEALPTLGIPSVYLSLYDKGSPEWANLLLAIDRSEFLEVEAPHRHFPARRLVPEGLFPRERRSTWVVEALYFQNERLGFGIFEMGIQDGTLYTTIRQQLSSALKGALLLKERKQTEKKLQEAYKELEKFSYSISHDLRAPLRAIHGYTTIVLDEYANHLPPTGQTYLFKALDSVEKMNQLILDILTFSRLSSQPLLKREVNPKNIVDEVLELFHEDKKIRQIQIEIGNLPVCYADPALLRQVFSNLISNAIKYTRPREVAHIEINYTSSSGENIYFVRDNGVGFDMKYGEKLFGFFQRLHTESEFEGNGIGLAISQQIINRHGGRIWFESKVNEGTAFFFTIE